MIYTFKMRTYEVSVVVMKRFACIILIVAILVSGLFFVRVAHATVVAGTLTSDTEWTQADSPVDFNGSVTVSGNVTLTIDPGVTVNFGVYPLNVAGTLMAVGTASNPITFLANNTSSIYPSNYVVTASVVFGPPDTPLSELNCSGSIIQYAFLNEINIQISNSSPKIDNCFFNFTAPYNQPISIFGGSPTISNCTISYNVQGVTGLGNVNSISIYNGNPLITNNEFEGNYVKFTSNDIYVGNGAPVITNNTFESNYDSSNNNGITVNSGTPQITYNKFQGNSYLTAIVDSSPTSFTVSGNVFSNCLSGVTAQAGSTLTVEGNSFLSGTDGIDVETGAFLTITDNLIDSNSRYGINGGGDITFNTITNNQIGIHNPPLGTISYNNIVGNTQYSITATIEDIGAQNNWWGIADARTINQTIYDSKCDYHLGTITFVPFLTEPDPSAPAIPNSTPTITPVPTQTTLPPQTSQPIIQTPSPTPYQNSQSFVYQVGSLLNLNLITTFTAVTLVLVWVVVTLGYAAKKHLQTKKS
jgi:hypothetical protein